VIPFADLAAQGCLCGTESPAGCPVHKAGDNRGLRAFFEAGMPKAFPTACRCALCGAEGLLYPNVGLDSPPREAIGDATVSGYKPTVICPRCSAPVLERALVAEVEASGLHDLNDSRVFA
jgi:hypothetical protein